MQSEDPNVTALYRRLSTAKGNIIALWIVLGLVTALLVLSILVTFAAFQRKTVVARRFLLVDEHGRLCGSWAVDTDQLPSLVMGVSRDTTQIEMGIDTEARIPFLNFAGLDGKRRLELAIDPDESFPYLSFMDKREKMRAMFGAVDNRAQALIFNSEGNVVAGLSETDLEGGVAFVSHPGGSRALELGASGDEYGYLHVNDARGTNRIAILAGNDSGLIVRDADSRQRMGLLCSSLGRQELVIHSPAEETLLNVGVNTNHQSFMQLFDATGQRRFWSGLYGDGAAGLQVIGHDGEVKGQLP